MASVKITDKISWVGVLNPELRVFDVIMETKWGTSYNAFIVKGSKKTALFEAVKKGYGDTLTGNIKEICPIESIDYIVTNHTEPDHTGAIEEILNAAPNAEVVGTRAALNNIGEIINKPFPSITAKEGMVLDLGGLTLKFIMAPFLHWPDSMFTYIEEEKVLISGDVFGCHFSPTHEELFECAICDDFLSAQKYYFDVIFDPFKSYLQKAIDKIRNLDIDIICPSHGPILSNSPWDTIKRFDDWSRDVLIKNETKKVFVGYVSAYGCTKALADAIVSGVKSVSDYDVELVELSQTPLDEIIGKIDKSDAVILGSPTINRDVMPPVWNVMTCISTFKNKGKKAAAFGSYGWSGEASAMIAARLKSLGMNVMEDNFRIKLVPSEKQVEEAYDYGVKFGEWL